ncbi:LytTR family transcriptional regulator DNA-binding domain-containing protein [Bacillus sp. DX1.1]|uniref:LytTR family transcriptional regulator DNA-binding domain-containing protein n=1 Tax=unclassified Bacillus (in: firmicutes) TaxID=185979 RepID=UPI0025701679|nr:MULTISPECIES: LytTR family transcriptional regulator DNA-binding domain-containing protein [unclassified Bacillus (in: firmicutes)]MDM5157405.1 LytTR family transcriptional regulator DNA-binding domain-containing protein [Bacillus sp. DX1.1]WJE81628.1 LytTR family transcriptional regulator DNA-binding domain-containing protein [Bacillus sp. DX3.1]
MALFELKQLGKTNQLPTTQLKIEKGQCVVLQCNNHTAKVLHSLIIGAEEASTGSVLFDGEPLRKQVYSRIGFCFLKDEAYDRLKVKEYFAFLSGLYESNVSVEEVVQYVGLVDKLNIKIEKLTFSEKRRLHIGRVMIHNPDLIIFEEPEQNVDIESTIMIRKAIMKLKEQGKAIFITSAFLSDALSLTEDVYVLHQDGVKKVEIEQEENEEVDAEKVVQMIPQMKLERIPAKVNDKIILIDPTEIHFIESQNGTSHIHVRDGDFMCTLTLSELEERLKGFGFFRCHRSYLVNLQRVREVITWTRNSFSLILDDERKSSIPLSKGRMDELKAVIGL